MDRSIKSFIVASLVYLTLAALLGLWMGVAPAAHWARFAHVHFNLLGFMAMMVYGVGYFILPRFNARELYWPSWVWVHFVLANIGLVGMVLTAPERPGMGFVLFSLISVAAVVMFATNIGVTILLPDKDEAGIGGAQAEALPEIGPDTRVGALIEAWPKAVEVLVAQGLKPLADPGHREQLKQLPVTLAMACGRHGLDLDAMLQALRQAVATVAPRQSTAPKVVQIKAKGPSVGEAIAAHHVIGDILKVYPQTREVFRKYYGAACFSCPGQATESVTQSAMLHNVPVAKILDDLNAAIAE